MSTTSSGSPGERCVVGLARAWYTSAMPPTARRPTIWYPPSSGAPAPRSEPTAPAHRSATHCARAATRRAPRSRARSGPGEVLLHAAAADLAQPPGLRVERPARAAWPAGSAPGVEGLELDAGAVRAPRGHDRVLQPARRADDGHRAVAQRVHLVQAARLVAATASGRSRRPPPSGARAPRRSRSARPPAPGSARASARRPARARRRRCPATTQLTSALRAAAGSAASSRSMPFCSASRLTSPNTGALGSARSRPKRSSSSALAHAPCPASPPRCSARAGAGPSRGSTRARRCR